MKRLSLIALMLISALTYNAKAQEATVNEKLTEVNDKINGLTERLATDEADLQKLTKIKVSGYIQAQYQNFESLAVQPTNYFSLRRVRVKFTYEAADGVKFVLCPDFAPGNLSLKDAYVVLNDRWSKAFSLWAGKFNRPNYEVQYSSEPARSCRTFDGYPYTLSGRTCHWSQTGIQSGKCTIAFTTCRS